LNAIWGKHSSLFVGSVSEEEEKLYGISTRQTLRRYVLSIYGGLSAGILFYLFILHLVSMSYNLLIFVTYFGAK
jgi:hypothetical protein